MRSALRIERYRLDHGGAVPQKFDGMLLMDPYDGKPEYRAWRTLLQSIVSPVLSTSLYFVVFGAAIGSRITAVDGVAYGAFIVPGLVMLSLLTQSIANASFGIYFPRRAGSGFLNRVDKWRFCLTAARMAAEQERR